MNSERLAEFYARVKLSAPAILTWPLDDEAEKRRRLLESAFLAASLNPPPGLEWIRSHTKVKYRPDKIVEGCQSILVSALGYCRHDEVAKKAARVARYARGRDYHRELGNRLRQIARQLKVSFPNHHFRPFTDIGPLDERWLAEESQLGFTGRHTLTIHPRLGSWVVLGHIVSTYPFKDSTPPQTNRSCPPRCRRCVDACPTDALSLPGRLNASCCISYLTIEHPGAVESPLAEAVGDRLFGCDACQEACPFNNQVKTTEVKGFLEDIAGAFPNLEEVLMLKNHQDVVHRFAGSPLMRAKRSTLVRNACVAAGNSGDLSLISILTELTSDSDAIIAIQARKAINQLKRSVHQAQIRA